MYEEQLGFNQLSRSRYSTKPRCDLALKHEAEAVTGVFCFAEVVLILFLGDRIENLD